MESNLEICVKALNITISLTNNSMGKKSAKITNLKYKIFPREKLETIFQMTIKIRSNGG